MAFEQNLLRTLAPYVDRINALETAASTFNANRSTILSRHTTYGAEDSIESVESSIDSTLASIASSIDILIQQCREILEDRDLLSDQFDLSGTPTSTEIYDFLFDYFASTSPDRRFSTPTVGIGGSDYLGAGANTNINFYRTELPATTVTDPSEIPMQMLSVIRLDGISNPGNGAVASPKLAKEKSLFLNDAEQLIVEVDQDAGFGGQAAGSETFRISSKDRGEVYDGQTRSSGTTTQLASAQSLSQAYFPSNVAGQGRFNFDASAADTPTGWTIDSGTPGTAFSSDEVNTYRGSPGLKIESAQASQISRSLAVPVGDRRRMFALCWWVKFNGAGGGDAQDILLDDDGVADSGLNFGAPIAAVSATDTEDGSDPGSWKLAVKLYVLQDRVTTNYTMKIVAAGDNAGGTIGGIYFCPVQYHAGFGHVFIPGQVDPVAGDKTILTLTNTPDVNIQTEFTTAEYHQGGDWALFFAKAFGLQMPVRQPSGTDLPLYDQILLSTVDGAEDLTTVPAA